MSLPDGECRSVSYGVMKIWKLVVIVRKCKMGGCENHYLVITWAAPNPFKNWFEQTTQKGGKGVFFEPIGVGSSMGVASPPEMINWMHTDLKIEVKNGFSSMIEKRPSGMPRAVFLV